MKHIMNCNQRIEQWLNIRKDAFESEIRPFVTLSYAQSWGGSITTKRGQPVVLSGADSNLLTHQLRSLHDGILVGIDTVLADDPQLTVRYWSGENPQPIILDTALRMPKNARLCHHPDKDCWVFTTRIPAENEFSGVEIIPLVDMRPSTPARISTAQSAMENRNNGVARMIVEVFSV
ncbi:MAG: RibD family protein [Desulfuromonas sp.]|nr:RibD family protein [Desulfuromonas sp.]